MKYYDSSMRIFLNSYYPLQHTDYGRQAIINFPELHPLEDGSIRREPDLKNNYPAISGLCRPDAMNRIQLSPNNIIIFKTNGSHYLSAILKVIKKLNNHNEAKEWYEQRTEIIPSNCVLVDHIGLEKSHARDFEDEIMEFPHRKNSIERRWDRGYQERGLNATSSHFFLTEPIYNAVTLNLDSTQFIKIDKILRKHDPKGWIPNTQFQPQKLSELCYSEILNRIQEVT